ncbi:MAG: protein kinase [Candidatus Krumholzibacteriota bacterium]
MQERMVSHYKILECLGGGAMGQVFKAEDTLLHRPVALKFLPAELTEDEEASRRFMREARATSSLDHPNICAIHEIAQADDGSWYIAMAWYEGRNLKKVLSRGALPPEQALSYARQTALGLGDAHDHGVIHRDIKPANLIVTDRDDVKILDFGLARLLGKARLTRTGTVMGTAAYMSPEQARGEDVGTSSDIWSLGVVLYEMLSGQVPFDGDSDVAMIYSVLHSDPAPLPQPVCRNSKICTDIIHNCLARDPGDRYPSAHVLADDIESAMEGSKTSFGSKPSGSSIFAPPGRPRWHRLLPALVALVLLLALAFPQSRSFLRSIVPFASGPRPVGVAVIPFHLTGDVDDATAFGLGLSNTINDRLAGLEQHSGRFWVVPAGEVKRRQVVDDDRAQTVLGVQQIITGTGNLSGKTINLTLTVHDTRDNSYQSKVFRDFSGNLKIWQSDLLSWLAGIIDPELEAVPDRFTGAQNTTIPSAFLAYQRGFGHLAEASAGPDDEHTVAALPYLERAVANDSSFSCAWTQLGRAVFFRYGPADSVRVSEAEAYLATAVRLDSTAVWPHHYLGTLRARLGDTDAALGEYRRALALDPRHAPTLNSLANMYYWNGEEKRAEAAFDRAIDARPYYPRAHRNAGAFHYQREDMEKARENFQAMVELVPDDELGYRMLGIIYYGEDDYENAETMFKRSLALKETNGTYANLGTLYYYDQRYTDSIVMSQKALELGPDDFDTWRTLAAAYYFAPGFEDSVRPAYEKAMELLRVEMALYPENPGFKADQASFYHKLGEPETALAILSDLETNHSDLDPWIMFSMASTYEELGDRDRALDWLENALERELSFKRVERYPVLKNLQSHPRYIALRKKYEQ